ncbi:hypothetical protein [Neomoorella humiferrea]|uniref:hypothetical protein n=1 Tax=Neomoorella humiferrea TaxID=676965 RepID=UPI00147360CA|nr:hypothetical protein [Moorella humiferrea]
MLGENGIRCVDRLSECLDEGDYDNDTRQVWLATLMEERNASGGQPSPWGKLQYKQL